MTQETKDVIYSIGFMILFAVSLYSSMVLVNILK